MKDNMRLDGSAVFGDKRKYEKNRFRVKVRVATNHILNE